MGRAGMDTTADLALRVAQRFMVVSDDRFRPPKNIVNGVSTGELPVEVLGIWKYTVNRLSKGAGSKTNFGAAVAYWRNKCAKEGIELPGAYLKGGKGSTHGEWKVKRGDEIEVWVRERLESAGLASATQMTAAEWELEISHLQSGVDDAKDRIAKHESGLAEGNKVKQRTAWLLAAQKDLELSGKDLEKARAAVQGLQETIEKHEDVEVASIDFEKQFQLMLHQAANDLSKRDVLAQAKAALEKFEAEMNSPKFASDKQADAADLWNMVKRGWDGLWKRVMSAFAKVEDWAKDVLSSSKSLDKLIASGS